MSSLGSPNPLLFGAAKDYEIDRSLRLAAESSACYHRTWSGDDANLQKQTYSFWIKRTTIGTAHYMFTAWNNSNTDRIGFTSDNQFFIELKNGGSTEAEFHSDRVFRDPSAWMHVVVAFDTTDGTTDNRMKAYINNELITDWDTKDTIGQNYSMEGFGRANKQHVIGAYASSNTDRSSFFDGYMADFYFIDGQQLTPSSFGEENANTGQWVPIKYTGTYGSKGWYINFSDNSDTTELGRDSSGNSQDFTPDNISVASGEGNDSVTDTPTKNFCTWSDIDSKSASLSNGGLVFKDGNGAVYQAHGTMATPDISAHKYYFEAKVAQGYAVGIAPLELSGADSETSRTGTYVVYSNGNKYEGTSSSSYTSSWSSATVIGVAIGEGNIKFFKAGSDEGNAFTGLSGPYKPYAWAAGSTGTGVEINCGQQPFQHTPPTGYVALCTANLPEPAILKGNDYFNSVLYTGNGVTDRPVTGVGFNPDLVWIKNRSSNNWHNISDTVTGITWNGATNSADAYGNNSNIKTTTSDGFTLGTHNVINGSGLTYVAWNWLESSNAGFDIVTYEGNQVAGRTVAHNLGVKPDLIIVKNIDQDGQEYGVYHKDIGATKALFLEGNGAQTDNAIFWNDTEPTDSVFSVGTASTTNEDTLIAYVWASVEGYSRAGVYTGNGDSTDGPMVYTGFKPSFVLIKCSSNAENWNIFDEKRDPDNKVHHLLVPNTNTEENSTTAARELDFLSNGFKLKGSDGTINTNNYTYVYMAFAKTPFKYSNAR